jgi:signal transduction histidine kinase
VPFEVEHRVRRADGEYRWVIGTGRPRFGPQDEYLGYIGSIFDITDRKRVEEALKETDRHKDEFLATLAHELRNPLAPISNALTLLGRGERGPDADERMREMMQRQVQRLVRLIDDLLDSSRISRGNARAPAPLRRSRCDPARRRRDHPPDRRARVARAAREACRRSRSISTPTRSGSPRCSATCSTTRPSSAVLAGRICAHRRARSETRRWSR